MSPISATAPDLDKVVRLVSEPAWGSLGMHARMSYAMLTCEQRGGDKAKAVADLFDDESLETSFEDTLVQMCQARIAILDIAAMMKASLRDQWKAVDALLISRGYPAMGVDDELCGDDELLALRPAFDAGRTKMKIATAAVARASKRYDERHPSMVAAYAKQSVAVDADRALADQVAGIRARTKEGIRFKQEVRAHWRDCELPHLDRSIHADLIAYVEASP